MNDFIAAWLFVFVFVYTFVLFVTYTYELVVFIVKKIADCWRFN